MGDILEPLLRRERRRAHLAEMLKSLVEERDALKRIISGHENFNPEQHTAELARLHSVENQMSASLSQAEMHLRLQAFELKALKTSDVTPGFPPVRIRAEQLCCA